MEVFSFSAMPSALKCSKAFMSDSFKDCLPNDPMMNCLVWFIIQNDSFAMIAIASEY